MKKTPIFIEWAGKLFVYSLAILFYLLVLCLSSWLLLFIIKGMIITIRTLTK